MTRLQVMISILVIQAMILVLEEVVISLHAQPAGYQCLLYGLNKGM